MLNFEWDDDKAASNYAKHHIRFDQAMAVFFDPNAVESYDNREHYGEDRFLILGFVDPDILAVVYTERDGDTYRIISARKATTNERKIYENHQH